MASLRRRAQPWVMCAAALSSFAGRLLAQPDPVQFVGANVCGSCHRAEFARQALSAHAGALSHAVDHPLANAFPTNVQLRRSPNYRFEVLRTPGELRSRIFDTTEVMDLPMEWAFGAGRKAVTFVTKVNQDWYVEHYASYYPAVHSWGPTPGQSAIRPTSLATAAGVLYNTTDPAAGIGGCFECHSTGPVSFRADGAVQLTELAVRCEDCHGPGGDHAKRPSSKNIQNPKTFSAARLNEFCGRCHRPPAAPGQKIDWNVAWNVRHQPLYLNESACFRKSGGALSCLTCHDPHEPAGKKDASFYNDRCLGCHSSTAPPPKAICQSQASVNCIDCHMPLVSPQGSLRFTNHWIGVYGAGAKLKPLR
jgi:cytochrome c554/c'-like protein